MTKKSKLMRVSADFFNYVDNQRNNLSKLTGLPKNKISYTSITDKILKNIYKNKKSKNKKRYKL